MLGNSLRHADESTKYAAHTLDVYSETKILQEKLVLGADSSTLHTVAIRPHGIFGPHDPNTIPSIVQKAKEGKMKFIIGLGVWRERGDIDFRFSYLGTDVILWTLRTFAMSHMVIFWQLSI